MCQWTGPALVQVIACRLFGAKPLPEPMLPYCRLDTREQTSMKFESKYKSFHSWNCMWKCRLRNGGHFVQGRWVNNVVSTVPADGLAVLGSDHNAWWDASPDCKVHGANMGPTGPRWAPCGPMNFAIWASIKMSSYLYGNPQLGDLSTTMLP